MSWTATNGTQAATIGTEHILDTETTNATYVFKADLSAMIAGDVVELRMYTKVLTGGSLLQVWKGTFDFYDASINPVALMPPLPSDFSAKFTLKQVAGTGESFPWSVLRQ